MRRDWPLVLVAAVAAAASGAAAQVELRGERTPLAGQVASVTLGGVEVRQPGSDRGARLVGWDRVRSVAGEFSAQALAYAEVADRAWRARARLERGDWPAAEPLFEDLFRAYRGAGGPTAALAARGLLECRLRRGASTLAVWPWLEWVRIEHERRTARDGPEWLGGEVEGAVEMDPALGLVPALPPVWLPGPSLDALASSDEWGAVAGEGGPVGEPARSLAALYRRAARFEAGMDVPEVEVATEHDGVRFVRDVVAARAGSAGERAAARRALRERMDRDGRGWIEVWCRIAVGRSLLRETDAASRRLGVVELLHVPARFGREEPYLAGVAIALCAVALAETGDVEGAGALVAELLEAYPGHAALEWDRVGALRAWVTVGRGAD